MTANAGDLDAAQQAQPGHLTQLEQVLELADGDLVLLRDDQGRPFARAADDPFRRVFAIPSRACDRVLQQAYRRVAGKYVRRHVMDEAMEHLAAAAVHGAPEEKVWLRVGRQGDTHYLDLGGEEQTVVEIDAEGWRLGDSSPINFVRRPGTQPLPPPVPGLPIDLLRQFVNVPDGADFKLLIGWLLMTFSTAGPYPVLILEGEQGSAKSTTSRVLKALTDPVAAPLRSAPRTDRDLAILAESNHVVVFDNLSGLPINLSDSLCRLSTGGGFGTRALYTDDEERVFSQQRPVILNGIDAIATRQDLLDRAIVLNLPRLHDYSDELTFWERFEGLRPYLLGAILDGVSHALAHRSTDQQASRHRMADFLRWASAGVPAYGWDPAEIEEAYGSLQKDALRASLEGSPVAWALEKLFDGMAQAPVPDDTWHGTATALHEELSARSPDLVRSKRWPGSPQALSRHLVLLTPALESAGFEVEFGHDGRGRNKVRSIMIVRSIEVGTPGTPGTP